MFGFFKRRRREQLKAQPFSTAWQDILLRRFPFYERLDAAGREALEDLIQIFLGEKVFEGCGGQEITDEVRVLIAAQACFLLLNREVECYPKLKTVLVYPSAYFARGGGRHGDQEVQHEVQGRLGESWDAGVVVLAWDATLAGAANVMDGRNLVYHEFAHQLDQEDGAADGAPTLPADSWREKRGRYLAWAKIMGEEYGELQKAIDKGQKTVIDDYGGSHPAEFFAVATECFFEKPRQLRKNHPALYEELKKFYQQDPETYVKQGN
ncbi:MAG: zinc-dependent peptidase [Verrucomicrobiota bacterium]